MGSEKYPHKGVLDLLANRGFSNGTNAWTDTDHTAYTISTAGEQGFLQLLPIYVDHILYPTITKAGFVLSRAYSQHSLTSFAQVCDRGLKFCKCHPLHVFWLAWQVHHIDGKGQDSGVVYSEMQGRENTSGDLMAIQFVRQNTSSLSPLIMALTGSNVWWTRLEVGTAVKQEDSWRRSEYLLLNKVI